MRFSPILEVLAREQCQPLTLEIPEKATEAILRSRCCLFGRGNCHPGSGWIEEGIWSLLTVSLILFRLFEGGFRQFRRKLYIVVVTPNTKSGCRCFCISQRTISINVECFLSSISVDESACHWL